jgi:hypothetical protein
METLSFIKKVLLLLDENSGIVMIILTAVYVGATIAIHRGNAEAVKVAKTTKNVELLDQRLKLADKVEQSSDSHYCLGEHGFERRFKVLFPDEKLLEQLGKYKGHRRERKCAESDATYYGSHPHPNIKEGFFEFENRIIRSFSDTVSEDETAEIKQLAKEREIYKETPVKELSRWLNLYEIYERQNISQQREEEAKAKLIIMMQEYISKSIN